MFEFSKPFKEDLVVRMNIFEIVSIKLSVAHRQGVSALGVKISKQKKHDFVPCFTNSQHQSLSFYGL